MDRHVHSAIEHSKRPKLHNEHLPMVQADRKTLADEVERLCADARAVSRLLELGDQRLLASDGPCGGQNAATALSPEESAELYQAVQRISAWRPE